MSIVTLIYSFIIYIFYFKGFYIMKSKLILFFAFLFYCSFIKAENLSLSIQEVKDTPIILEKIHSVSLCVEKTMMQKLDETQLDTESFYLNELKTCSTINDSAQNYYVIFKSVHYDDARPYGIRAFIITPFLLTVQEKLLLEEHILNHAEIYQPAYMKDNILHSIVKSLSIKNGQEKTILITQKMFLNISNVYWQHFQQVNSEQLILDITLDYPL